MNTLEKIGLLGLVPVVVFDDIEDALPTAKAMVEGGLPIMEITLRTPQGLPAIEKIGKAYPEILLGAGTVLSVEQAKSAVEAGAKFIVSPGLNDDVVKWCLDNDVPITPGCVTPTEIEHALGLGLKVLKFFPASVYGGINGCKALYGPYRMIKFIPTGGVALNNLSEYVDKTYIHAIGGGWLCSPKDMKEKKYENITKTVKASIDVLLGFELAHVGINMASESEAKSVAKQIDDIFGFGVKEGNSSVFAGTGFEIMKSVYKGENGHIAIKTNNIERAIYYLGTRGYQVDAETKKEKDGKMVAVYLSSKDDIGGFALHLVQK